MWIYNNSQHNSDYATTTARTTLATNSVNGTDGTDGRAHTAWQVSHGLRVFRATFQRTLCVCVWGFVCGETEAVQSESGERERRGEYAFVENYAPCVWGCAAFHALAFFVPLPMRNPRGKCLDHTRIHAPPVWSMSGAERSRERTTVGEREWVGVSAQRVDSNSVASIVGTLEFCNLRFTTVCKG